MIADWQVKQRMGLDLEAKVTWALMRIREWHEHFADHTYVAFSGGKDSQVLLHLVRSLYPDTPAVFYAEPTFPEVLAVVRSTHWAGARCSIGWARGTRDFATG